MCDTPRLVLYRRIARLTQERNDLRRSVLLQTEADLLKEMFVKDMNLGALEVVDWLTGQPSGEQISREYGRWYAGTRDWWTEEVPFKRLEEENG